MKKQLVAATLMFAAAQAEVHSKNGDFFAPDRRLQQEKEDWALHKLTTAKKASDLKRDFGRQNIALHEEYTKTVADNDAAKQHELEKAHYELHKEFRANMTKVHEDAYKQAKEINKKHADELKKMNPARGLKEKKDEVVKKVKSKAKKLKEKAPSAVAE